MDYLSGAAGGGAASPGVIGRFWPDRLAGVLFVLALHAMALWGLWSHRLIPSPREVTTLFINFITPPEPPRAQAPKPRPVAHQPPPRQLVAQTPLVMPTDPVAPPPRPEITPVIAAPAMPLPVGPVALSSELSVACPERSAPPYPALSRRRGESGTVVLRVELSETGHVAAAQVRTSSGHARLDEAALAAVRTWRCNPASRNGQAVRAVALQPFDFVMSGS